MIELDVVEMKRALEGMAEILSAYLASLVEHGFTREEAFGLVVAYQTTTIRNIREES